MNHWVVARNLIGFFITGISFGYLSYRRLWRSLFFLLGLIGLSGTAWTQRFDELTKIAFENNLSLKVLEGQYKAALERGVQVSQLPDPEVGLGVFALPVETRLGPQYVRIGATQMFPWKGTLQSKKEVEEAKAQTIGMQAEILKLDIVFDLKQAYFNYYEIVKGREIIGRNIEILEALRKIALSRVENGEGSSADVLRVQLKVEELKQELDIQEVAKYKPLATINQLLNRPPQTMINAEDSLSMALLPFSRDSLEQLVRANHPIFHILSLEQDVSNKRLKLNSLAGKPSFGLGLDYILVGGRTDADPLHNGRDIVQPRASISVPLNQKKYQAKAREEHIIQASLNDQKGDFLSRYLAAIEKAYIDYEMARLRIDSYEKQAVLARSAIDILTSTYSVNGSGFDELLRLEKELIDYDLKIMKAIVQSHQAKTVVLKYINHNN